MYVGGGFVVFDAKVAFIVLLPRKRAPPRSPSSFSNGELTGVAVLFRVVGDSE